MSQRVSLCKSTHNRHSYVWLHDTIQQAAYNSLTPAARVSLYSKIGRAFLQTVKPEHLNGLLYEVLALLNKGADAENVMQRQSIANLNLSVLSKFSHNRQAGQMAFKNAAFETAAYHLTAAVSYFGGTTWNQGRRSC